MTASSLDYRFDRRVSRQYDVLRGHPPTVSAAIGRAIAAIAGERARVLELGVGTGRIALPAAAAGCEICGVDLSPHMLASLSERVRTDALDGIHLIRCDIAKLPFRDAVFDAVLAVHVLHLVSDWADVLAQISHLVRPGGRLMLGRDWIDPDSISGLIRNKFRRTVVEVGTEMLPPGAAAAAAPAAGTAIVSALSALGAHPLGESEVVAAEWRTELTPRQILEGIRSRDDAESWVLPDNILTETMRRLDSFATEQWPDLDQPRSVKRRFLLSIFGFED
jgi:SAM-dependent methyltransferase